MTQDASFDVVAQDGRELSADPNAAGEKTFGRQTEVQTLARTLSAGRSVVLVGPSGVGKTAIVQKLLSYLRQGRAPEIEGSKIFEISTVGLCADTRFTGQQEGRIRSMLVHATRKRLHYIPDLWNLPYAGSYSHEPARRLRLDAAGHRAGQARALRRGDAGAMGQARARAPDVRARFRRRSRSPSRTKTRRASF